MYANEVTIDDKNFQVGKHVLALVSNYKYVGMRIAVHASAQPRFFFQGALNVSACETKCESKWEKYKKKTRHLHMLPASIEHMQPFAEFVSIKSALDAFS